MFWFWLQSSKLKGSPVATACSDTPFVALTDPHPTR